MRGWALLLLLTAGCSVGRNFRRPPEGALSPGTTTAKQIVEIMGKPYKDSSLWKNGMTYRMLSYIYVKHGSGGAHASGIHPERVMALLFLKNVLVGFEFHSSFEADHTDFDLRPASTVEKGITRRAELLALFGRPGGREAPPLVADGSEGLTWSYTHGKDAWRYSKKLSVTLDRDAVVSAVDFGEEGSR